MSACRKCGHDPDAAVHDRWEFVVDREANSLNRSASNNGSRWAQAEYRRRREHWAWSFRAARINARIPSAATRRRVTLTRLYSKRQRDYDLDNLAGGLKVAVDAMVLEGLIIGDAPHQVEIHYAQERSAVGGVRVLIEELAAPRLEAGS